MEATTAEQFNISYIRLPKNVKLLRLAFGLQKVIGEIFSFTGKDKGGNDLSCFRSYNKFMARCGVSRATVGRALRTGRTTGLIKGDRKEGFEYLVEADYEDFYRLPSWICKDEFAVRKNEKRKLTNAEQHVYAVLYTYCTKRGNWKHEYSISITELAQETGLSERTVQRALWTIIRAGLIYRPKKNKGVNRYKVSKYKLNHELVRQKEKNEKAIRKEAERVLREKEAQAKAPAEPFSEFAAEARVGEEEFVLHNQTKPRAPKKLSKQKIDVPEAKFYMIGKDCWGLPEYDLSRATDEELKSIKAFYAPLWQNVDVLGQGFLMLVGLEINTRTRGSPLPGVL